MIDNTPLAKSPAAAAGSPLTGARAQGRPHVVNLLSNETTPCRRVPFGPGRPVDEAWLQELLFEHPELLPIAELEPGFGAAVPIAREMATAHGPIDLVYLTGGGDIIIVETKLWANVEARRAVVAQALDYAAAMGSWTYTDLERAVLARRPKVSSLHSLVAGLPEALDEQRFFDAVADNLAAGRLLIIIAGDGIRREVETLTRALGGHAGQRFSLALVELALHEVSPDMIVVQPSTLMRTTLIERGVVRIEQGRVEVLAAPERAKPGGGPVRAGSLTEDAFMAEMAKRDPRLPQAISAFLEELAPLGVYAEYKASLNLKLEQEGADHPVNIGYIRKDGALKTDAVGWFAPKDLAATYVTALASMFGGTVASANDWSAAQALTKEGKPPKIETLLPKQMERWITAVRDLKTALSRRAAEAITP